ncbi:hypothetical protein FRB94_013120 [Tulasnella sp. JGI-2019a]|nr:hypothetical protein FRB94_013120 [Tulasnella sp. JGI-2019a]
MPSSSILLLSVLLSSLVTAYPTMRFVRRDSPPSPSLVASLAPQLDFESGLNPTGTGDCDGAVPGGPKIPCFCPPSQADFVTALQANVAAGHAVNNTVVPIAFPTDGSVASQAIRIESGLSTLQNLRGPGVGCPAVSSTLSAQLKVLQSPGATAASAPTAEFAPTAASVPTVTPAPSATPVQVSVSSSSSTSPSADVIASLAPQLEFESGLNPTGTGDCDGAVPGGPKIPCSCPPSQADFVTALIANVQAGHAVNNTVVPIAFPTDASSNSQAIRIESGLSTLQNLRGPGVGCPAVSSTLSAQLKALQR